MFIPRVPGLWLLRATSRRQAKEGPDFCACRHSVAACSAARRTGHTRARFVWSGLLSRGGGEESSPAPSERNAKHEHNRNPHLHRMPRNRSTAREQPRQAFQIPGSTTGMENCFTSRMSHPRCHATVRNSGSGSGLLENAHPQLVVFILNTRRRIKGHYLVSIGTMDTILCHPREVFRLAIMASAAAIIIAHNLWVAAHKLCYVKRRVMCSHRLAVLTSTRIRGRKECYARRQITPAD